MDPFKPKVTNLRFALNKQLVGSKMQSVKQQTMTSTLSFNLLLINDGGFIKKNTGIVDWVDCKFPSGFFLQQYNNI